MTPAEAKEILSGYRPGTEDEHDPFFAQALEFTRENPDLAQWFAGEQAFDLAISRKIQEGDAPFGLRTALLAAARTRTSERFSWTWPRVLAMAFGTALLTLLATIGLMNHFQSHGGMGEYRDEMVSFVNVPPTLPLKTGDMQEIRSRLADQAHLAGVEFPKGVMQLPALGCRSLFFRGHQVGLVCFRRQDNQLVHVFVIDKNAFATSALPREMHYKQDGPWGTAMWMKGDMVYLLATTGDRQTVESLL